MLKLNFVLLLLFLVHSCQFNHKKSMEEFYESYPPPKPTQKEIDFKNKLEKLGYTNVTFIIPLIGYNSYGFSTYSLTLDAPFSLTNKNSDSIKNANNNIADTLFAKILEDSIICDIEDFEINFNVRKSEIRKWSTILHHKYLKKRF